jgi:hypothetical protein
MNFFFPGTCKKIIYFAFYEWLHAFITVKYQFKEELERLKSSKDERPKAISPDSSSLQGVHIC